MNRNLIATALIAAATVASGIAYAGEANYDEQQQHVVSTRTRAEVKAAAQDVAKNYNWEPAGSRVAPQVASATTRSIVRAEAVAANRAGQIGDGELGPVL